jgi:hypothetical protein
VRALEEKVVFDFWRAIDGALLLFLETHDLTIGDVETLLGSYLSAFIEQVATARARGDEGNRSAEKNLGR